MSVALAIILIGLSAGESASQAEVGSGSSTSATAAAASSPAALASTSDEPDFRPRKPAELREVVRAALQASYAAKGAKDQDRTTRELMLRLLELEQDQNLPHDDRVALHAQVRSRLMSLEKTLRTQLKLADPISPDNPQTALLAQVAQPGANAVPRRIANAQGRTAQSADYGPELVDLIHTVVAPRSWDVNGGPGSVVYYRNLRVLVIRAPSDVHDQAGDVLGQLRK